MFKLLSFNIFALKYFAILFGITLNLFSCSLIILSSLISSTFEVLLRLLSNFLIKYFSLNLTMLKIESFLLINFTQDHINVLYPNNYKFFVRLIPLAVAKDPLNPEKFPGP